MDDGRKIKIVEGVKDIHDPHKERSLNFADIFGWVGKLLILWAMLNYYYFSTEVIEKSPEFLESNYKSISELHFLDRLRSTFSLSMVKHFVGVSDDADVYVPEVPGATKKEIKAEILAAYNKVLTWFDRKDGMKTRVPKDTNSGNRPSTTPTGVPTRF